MKHTPFDGSHPLFKIGLEPLELKNWIDVDEHLDDYLAEKARLKLLYPGKVFVAEAGTEAAQAEVLEMLIEHLVSVHRQTHRRDGSMITAGSAIVNLDANLAPLEIAS